MAHGGGGKLMQQLVQMFLAAFGMIDTIEHDAVSLQLTDKKIAFTTDSYVVKPLFFPGGDIGSLAVNGTVNDLAMAGARPLYLSVSFILEEGLPIETLWQIEIDEKSIPVIEEVRGACEILGFDPLYVANEGRFVAFIPQKDCDKPNGMAAQRTLEIVKSHFSHNAEIIGKVIEDRSLVTLKSTIGSKRIIDLLSGEQLPRIC